jgi:hypothetical protein
MMTWLEAVLAASALRQSLAMDVCFQTTFESRKLKKVMMRNISLFLLDD